MEFIKFISSMNLNLPSFSAIQAQVVSRETMDDYVRFTVNIMTVYKRGNDKSIHRGEQILWVSAQDLLCKCPKIRLHRRYLIIAKDNDNPNRPGILLDRKSLVIPWQDTWQLRLRKFQKQERKGRC